MTRESSPAEIDQTDTTEAEQLAINEIRTALVDRLILLMGWTALPLAALYSYRIFSGSLPVYFHLATAVLSSYSIVALMREKLSLQIKLTLLLVPPFVLSGITLNFQGLYSQGTLLFALIIVLCFFFKPGQTNIRIFTGLAVILTLVAAGHMTGAYQRPLALDDTYLAISRLVTTLILLAMFAVLSHFLLKAVNEKNLQFLSLQIKHELKIEELANAIEEINLLRKVVNVCAKCHKVNLNSEDSSQPEDWVSLQSYVARTSKVQLNHGFCPTCFDKAMAELDN